MTKPHLVNCTSLLLVCMALLSCAQKEESKSAAVQAVRADSLLPQAYVAALQSKMHEWETWLKRDTSASFNWEKYKYSHTVSLNGKWHSGSSPIEESEGTPRQYLLYNADSSMALDIYVNMMFEKKKNKIHYVSDGDPEPPILLYDVREQKYSYLHTGGTGSHYYDGTWIDSTTIAVVAFEFDYDTKYNYPFAIVFSLADSTTSFYFSHDSTKSEHIRDYLPDVKMTDVVFDIEGNF